MNNSIMNNRIMIIFLVLMIIGPAKISATGITPLISYQGRLLDNAGIPVSSTVSMTFWLYDAQTNGNPLWAETKNVQVINGIFSTYLGDITPLAPEQFNQALWLEIVVRGETLTPRQQLSGSPYALYSFNLAADAVISNETHDHDSRYPDRTYVQALETKVSSLEARINHLENILEGIKRNSNDIYIDGVNVHIRSGGNATDAPVNGLGNLIIGYNEFRNSMDNRNGSHNLILGKGNNYASYGGIVAGFWNEISGPYSSVTGGYANTASGERSAVIGGYANWASGIESSVSGGDGNRAEGKFSSISGGELNMASGNQSSISGGFENEASGQYSSISGGAFNTASGYYSSVSGGGAAYGEFIPYGNIASGWYSSVGGGQNNEASGWFSSVSGGNGNTASGYSSSVGGGYYNRASGSTSSITGGEYNRASNYSSSVSGGSGNIATGLYSSVSGGLQRNVTGSYKWVAGGLLPEQ